MRLWNKTINQKIVSFEYYSQNQKRESQFLCVGIFTKNRKISELKSSIDSLELAINSDIEVFIIVEEETSELISFLSMYQDPSIHIYINRENVSRIACKNEIMQISSGDYVLWLDAGDFFLNSTLSNIRRIFSLHSDVDIFYAPVEIRNEDRMSHIETPITNYSGDIAGVYQHILSGDEMPQKGVFTRRLFCLQYGGYDEKFLYSEELDLWSRFTDTVVIQLINGAIISTKETKEKTIEQEILEKLHRAKVKENLIQRVSLEKIYPDYNWKDIRSSCRKVITILANSFELSGDYRNVIKYLSFISINEMKEDQKKSFGKALFMLGKHTVLRVFFDTLRQINPKDVSLLELSELIKKELSVGDVTNFSFYKKCQNDISLELECHNKEIGASFDWCIFQGLLYDKAEEETKAIECMLGAYFLQPDNRRLIDWFTQKCFYKDYSVFFEQFEKERNISIRMLSVFSDDSFFSRNIRMAG